MIMLTNFKVYITKDGNGAISFIEKNEMKRIIIPKHQVIPKEIFDLYYKQLRSFKNRHYEEHNVKHVKIAIYAPGDLAFGISRMYDVITETEESPEEVMAFRSIKEAIRWLKK